MAKSNPVKGKVPSKAKDTTFTPEKKYGMTSKGMDNFTKKVRASGQSISKALEMQRAKVVKDSTAMSKRTKK